MQFAKVPATLLIVDTLLNRTKDEQRAFALQQLKICTVHLYSS